MIISIVNKKMVAKDGDHSLKWHDKPAFYMITPYGASYNLPG